MIDKELSRRTFLRALSGMTLLGLVSACSTTESSDQDEQKRKLADLRASKKYKEKKIEVGDNYYSPKQTTIEEATFVVWTNEGRSIHDVMWDDTDLDRKSEDFTSDTLRAGDIHVFLFEKPGTYFYHCHFHGGPKRGQWGSIKVNSTDRTL